MNVKQALALHEDSSYLLPHLTGRSLAQLLADPAQPLDPAIVNQLKELVGRRRHGEPLAYLLGSASFWTFDLRVDRRTLVPRSDTETLVERALARAPDNGRCLDLGTGAGPIAIALALARPQATVHATDVSADALACARANARRLQAAIDFKQSNWWEQISGGYDLIVSNPPYIREDDPHLDDLTAEPRSALCSGIDGLDALRAIIAGAPQHLRADGWLLVEHGHEQQASVLALFGAAGFTNRRGYQDLAGNDRVVEGQWTHGSPTA